MSVLIRILTTLFLLLLSCTPIFSQDISQVEYVDLGKFQIGRRGLTTGMDLPYYKPEGITQIPSAYFNALVVHKLVADGNEIIPVWQWAMSDDSIVGKYFRETEPEGSFHTVRMNWFWSFAVLTNDIVKRGIFYRSTATGRPYHYNVPYGSQKIELLYSIRFLIYDIPNRYRLMDTIESEIMGARWEYEWLLPEDED
jgi:hypothetical protein